MSQTTPPDSKADTPVRTRRELVAWRNAVFAIFVLSGLRDRQLGRADPRRPRRHRAQHCGGVGLLIFGMSIGSILGLIASPPLLAPLRRPPRHGCRPRPRRHRPRDRRASARPSRRLRAVIFDRPGHLRLRQRRRRRDDERRGRRGRARDRQDAHAALARVLQLRHRRRRRHRRPRRRASTSPSPCTSVVIAASSWSAVADRRAVRPASRRARRPADAPQPASRATPLGPTERLRAASRSGATCACCSSA